MPVPFASQPMRPFLCPQAFWTQPIGVRWPAVMRLVRVSYFVVATTCLNGCGSTSQEGTVRSTEIHQAAAISKETTPAEAPPLEHSELPSHDEHPLTSSGQNLSASAEPNEEGTQKKSKQWFRLANVTIPADSPLRNLTTINHPPTLYVVVKRNGKALGGHSSVAHQGHRALWAV